MKKFRLLTATTLLFLCSVGQLSPPVHARSPNEDAIAEKVTALIKDAITDGIKSYLKQEFLKFIGFDSSLSLADISSAMQEQLKTFRNRELVARVDSLLERLADILSNTAVAVTTDRVGRWLDDADDVTIAIIAEIRTGNASDARQLAPALNLLTLFQRIWSGLPATRRKGLTPSSTERCRSTTNWSAPGKRRERGARGSCRLETGRHSSERTPCSGRR